MYTTTQISSRIESSHGCAMGGIISFSCSINNSLAIVHGPTGCAGGYRMIFLLADKCPILPTTAIYQYELALGTTSKLQAALYKAARVYSPKVIFVILTCATSMIGEDYQDIIEQYQKDTGIKVFLEDGSSLFGEDNDGYRKSYDDFASWLNIEHEFDGKRIALDGMAASVYNSKKNMLELKKIVEDYCGLVLAPSISVEFDIDKDLQEYSKAKVIYIGLLNERSDTYAPIGFSAIKDFIKKISEITGKEIDQNIFDKLDKEREELSDDIDYLKTYLSKRYVMIEADCYYAVSLAKMLKEEFDCKLAVSSDSYGVEKLDELGICDWLEADVGGYELNEFRKELDCAISFGSSNVYGHNEECLYIPFTAPVWDSVEDNESLFGVSGMKYLTKKLKEHFHD